MEYDETCICVRKRFYILNCIQTHTLSLSFKIYQYCGFDTLVISVSIGVPNCQSIKSSKIDR